MLIATPNFFLSLLLISLLFCPTLLAKSSHPISDTEVRKNKIQCYADIDSGLWGWSCKSSAIARENCALRCLSPACYELIYESDPVRQSLRVIPFSIEFRSDTFFNLIEFFSCSLKREKKT
ncbi:hypothetical protein VIGAN_09024900 [Vigna angularis var. angularis]|uniref:Uncharacterized protein n=1 Tax=Vigna angularis var. angularis TaxID=157739 RepID=A0A0S3SW80_PHAAN|nr:hypothetical protein VIGAN_09024900 [Vigna angularis var. angularis]